MESVTATRGEVEHFLSIQQTIYVCCRYGHGIISSAGNGCSNNNGYGDGGGSGSGSANGSGGGYGNSDGYGTFHGDGYGYGNRYGLDYDNGSGYGAGCGGNYGDIKELNGNIVDYIDNVPTIITQVRGNIARGYIVKEDLTFESCFIAKVGDYFAHGKTLKEAVADAKVKDIEKLAIEERIEKFKEVFGSLDSEHTGEKFYDWHHILTGSCRMGRDGFCKAHKIDLEKKYTVRYFLDITENAYGGDVIKQIRESYGLMVNGDMPGYVLNIPSLAEEEGMTQGRLSEKYTMRGIYSLKDGYCETMGEPQEE